MNHNTEVQMLTTLDQESLDVLHRVSATLADRAAGSAVRCLKN